MQFSGAMITSVMEQYMIVQYIQYNFRHQGKTKIHIYF